MIYELRIYHVAQGKMRALKERFERVTLSLFEKHGVKVVSFWEDVESSENRLYYVVEYESVDQRNERFVGGFQKDPQWIAAKAKSEEQGTLVDRVDSYFMKNVPFFQ